MLRSFYLLSGDRGFNFLRSLDIVSGSTIGIPNFRIFFMLQTGEILTGITYLLNNLVCGFGSAL